MPKALAIIDVQTLFLSARAEYGPQARMDYVKLSNFLKEQDASDELEKVAYILASPFHDDHKFVQFLKNNNYTIMRKFAEVVKKPVNETENEGFQFKNRSWAGSMAWDILTTLPFYDKLYIVSGNGLFCPVVAAAKASGKKVTVLSFTSSLQKELEKSADQVIYLDSTFLFDAEEVKARQSKETKNE